MYHIFDEIYLLLFCSKPFFLHKLTLLTIILTFKISKLTKRSTNKDNIKLESIKTQTSRRKKEKKRTRKRNINRKNKINKYNKKQTIGVYYFHNRQLENKIKPSLIYILVWWRLFLRGRGLYYINKRPTNQKASKHKQWTQLLFIQSF